MIDEELTNAAFGYYSWELKSQSTKPILAACDDCGKERETSKHAHHALCISCALKGNKRHFGRKHTKTSKILMSKNHTDCKGEKAYNYKGGRKLATTRANAKHRKLGNILILPLEPGEVGHHATDEYVIGIPKDVHEMLCGGGRKKHRTKVLQWLKANDKKKYKLVLCVLAKETPE
jgi:hypothetical protein